MIFKSLKDRINCTIIIFTACFLTVVCLITGFIVRKSWTDDFVGKVSNLFLQNSERINAQLRTYDMTLDLVMQNRVVEKVLTGEVINTDISTVLDDILSVNYNSSQLIIISPRLEKCFSGGPGYMICDYERIVEDASFKDFWNDSEADSFSVLSKEKNNHCFSYYRKIFNPEKGCIGVAAAVTTLNDIFGLYTELDEFAENFDMFLVDRKNTVYQYMSNKHSAENYNLPLFDEKEKIWFNENTVTMTSFCEELDGCFVFFCDLSGFFNRINSIIYTNIFISLMFLILTVILSNRLGRAILVPMKKLRDKVNDVMVSKYNGF